jgi:WD40 repeat protein
LLPILLLLGISIASDDGECRPVEPAALTDSLGDLLPPGVLARIGPARFQHSHAASLAFSPDGKTLATAGTNGVRLWDVATGRLKRRFVFEAAQISGVAFTADGITVAGLTWMKNDTRVTFWRCDPASGTVHTTLLAATKTRSGCLSADGRRLAFSVGTSLCVYETVAGREILRVPLDELFGGVSAMAPDGKTIAAGDTDGIVRVRDAGDGKVVRELTAPNKSVHEIVYSRDGRYLAVASNRDRLPSDASVWDLHSGERVRVLKPPSGVESMAFTPDGRHLALGGSSGELGLVDFRSGEATRRFGPAAWYVAVTFSPDGKTLAALPYRGTIGAWETGTARALPGSADPTTDNVTALAFSGDGKELRGSAGVPFGTGRERVAWDTLTGREVRRYGRTDGPTTDSALSPDEKLWVAWSKEKGWLEVYEAATGNKLRSFDGFDKQVLYVFFSPDGRRLISQNADGIVRQWDVATGRDRWHFRLPESRPRPLKPSADGRWLIGLVAPRDAIAAWDLSTGREKRRFDWAPGEEFKVTLSVEGHFLTAIKRARNDVEIRRWDVETGQALPAVSRRTGEVESGRFEWFSEVTSPDGRMALTTRGIKVRLVEVATGGLRREFNDPDADILSFAFAPDGRRLATASTDAPVYIWDVRGGGKKGATPAEIARCWPDLADKDAAVAFRAIGKLAAAPDAGVRLLRDQLKPASPPAPQQIARLIQGLDSDSFSERQQSVEGLKKLGDAATNALREARAAATSAEARRQLDDLLERPAADTSETLRAVRAVEALEWMATPGAAALLDELARGAAGARLTCEASIARERLRRNQVAPIP